MLSSEESDVEMSSKLVPMKKTTKKPPRSPINDILTKHEEPKKVSTKIMIHKALTELRSRKGVSLYAIKKNMEENYKVDTEKINYYIKKYIKDGVEAGTIVQTKGIGATGSFRLAAVKEKVEKTKKIAKDTKPKALKEKLDGATGSFRLAAVKEKVEKTKKIAKDTKPKALKEELEKSPLPKKIKIGVEKKKKKTEKKDVIKKKLKPQTKMEKPKMAKTKAEKIEANATKKKSTKREKGTKTPTKKMKRIKRTSIGSIIKPPKMKPKFKA